MKIRVLIQVILITLAVHSTGYADSNDKTLWRGAELGMTPAQVLKVFPDAIMNPSYDRETSPGKVIIPKLNIDNSKFEVHFLFVWEGLLLVILEAKNPSVSTFQSFENLLCLKYGKPIKVSNYPPHWGLHSREWYQKPLTIKISLLNQVDNTKLSIVYSQEKQGAVNSL
jgi:hypothetical protein